MFCCLLPGSETRDDWVVARSTSVPAKPTRGGYDALLGGVIELLDAARRMSARSVNALMTLTYWEVGRRLVEFEQP